MSTFVRCPLCGNMEIGTKVYRCKSCGAIYCKRCGPTSYCPRCRSFADGEWFASIG